MCRAGVKKAEEAEGTEGAQISVFTGLDSVLQEFGARAGGPIAVSDQAIVVMLKVHRLQGLSLGI